MKDVGADTYGVLSAFGFETPEIDALLASGAVAQAGGGRH
jgi:hypothetical protein